MDIGSLYIIAGPIGNLNDISKRAEEVISSADLILAEDTRITSKILFSLSINKRIESFHQHSSQAKIRKIISLLGQGENIVLLTDAGTPNISDPGNKLILEIVSAFGEKAKIIPIPGPSAITAAASIAHFPMDKFLFLGFPPAKKKRKKFFQEILESKHPVIFFESPHRIRKTIFEIAELLKSSNEKAELVVCRELTKKFETIYRGKPDKILEEIEERGEFTIILKKEGKGKRGQKQKGK